MARGPRFKEMGVMLTTLEGRVTLTVPRHKWTPQQEAAAHKFGGDLLKKLIRLGAKKA